MIKLEHTVLPSPEQMQFVIEGMRNPMNSWDKSDSVNCLSTPSGKHCSEFCKNFNTDKCYMYGDNGEPFIMGNNDMKLAQTLSKAGTDHRKFMRMMPVYVRITAPLYWWKEFDTYKVGTVASSCSTMHKIQEKEFTLEDFSCEHLDRFVEDTGGDIAPVWDFKKPMEYSIEMLNKARLKFLETKDKKYWWQMIQLLPSSYNQTRNVMLNYEVLSNMYHSRKNHKLDEWREFCKWVENLPYSELIIMED